MSLNMVLTFRSMIVLDLINKEHTMPDIFVGVKGMSATCVKYALLNDTNISKASNFCGGKTLTGRVMRMWCGVTQQAVFFAC